MQGITLGDFLTKASTPGPPWFYLATQPATEVESLLWPPSLLARHSISVRWLRARLTRTIDGLHQEMAAALQFPSYYGNNWDAMRDCLRDLTWCDAPSHLIVFWGCDELLADEPTNQLQTFGRQFRGFATELMEPYQFSDAFTRPVTAFHVLFQCSLNAKEETAARLGAAGIEAADVTFAAPA